MENIHNELSPEFRAFALNRAVYVTTFFALVYGAGALVERRGVKVNYTRKVSHFAFFFLPLLIDQLIPFPRLESAKFAVLDAATLLLFFGVFVEPLRRRSAFVRTSFASFDRPEDRPYTMRWVVLQGVTLNAALYLGYVAFALCGLNPTLMNVPIYTSMVGDGLAEPVGYRFGRHRYKTKGFLVDRVYERSLEGSACVFFSCLAAVALWGRLVPWRMELAALLILPPALTAVEAKAPHTLDNPLIVFAGALLLVAIRFWLI